MPQILPFRGFRYTQAAGPMERLLAPPYDVISPEEQRDLANRSPYNAVALELADGGEERYAHVAALLESWLAGGILARDGEAMLYVYEQAFQEAGRPYTRRALIAAVEAQPWEEGAVRPHEFTMSGPKEDRLKLLEATGVQLSPVFMLARDRAGQLRQFLDDTVAERPPDVDATTPDGDTHRLWAVEAGRFEMRRLAPLLSESFTIADGHHRYETAVTYKQRALERAGTLERDHPARFAMTAIVPAADPGLVVRPIHRIVPRPAPSDWRERLATEFVIEDLGPASGDDEFEAQLAGAPDGILALGLDAGAAHLLAPRDDGTFARIAPKGQSEEWMRVPANAVRYGVLQPLWGITDADLAAGAVEYTHLAAEVAARAASGDACGFLLHNVPVDVIIALAARGERMPQKSTFFYPKLGTGLAFYPLTP